MDDFVAQLLKLCLEYDITPVVDSDNKVEFRENGEQVVNLYGNIIAIMKSRVDELVEASKEAGQLYIARDIVGNGYFGLNDDIYAVDERIEKLKRDLFTREVKNECIL